MYYDKDYEKDMQQGTEALYNLLTSSLRDSETVFVIEHSTGFQEDGVISTQRFIIKKEEK